MEKMVMSEKGIVYFVEEKDLKHGYWFNSDHAFDVFFNDLKDYYDWKKYCIKDEDTYHVLDEYIQAQGKEYSGFPCEDAMPTDEIIDMFEKFRFIWDSYHDIVVYTDDVEEFDLFLTDQLQAVEVDYFEEYQEKGNYNKQTYVKIMDDSLRDHIELEPISEEDKEE